jgi:hypothetical protein
MHENRNFAFRENEDGIVCANPRWQWSKRTQKEVELNMTHLDYKKR